MSSGRTRNIIAGTAGHIDHGKTALVRALTGVDTDRLEEEKRRGISIDLGFAHLELSGGTRIGFIDVPGHERFVKNMLAGVGGIDFVLFVIAADESIKPQTREHFDICRLLQIPKGIIVLTKADLVERDLLELVRLEVDEFARGSFLENAPVVAVSAVTGEGLAELKGEMSRLAAAIHEKDATRWFRMPVDRAFSMKGFGTVLTGTLTSGSVSVEDEVELHPASRRVRVRGAQVHGEGVTRALAGQRTALNVAGLDLEDARRGMTLTAPGRFHSTARIETSFELLGGVHPLRHGAPVHFHSGTAEVEAEARLLEGSALQPGSAAMVRFLLREPLLLLPGDRFIVRMFSPVITIGGGVVLDIDAPERLKRSAAAERARALSSASVAGRTGLLVREAPFGLGLPHLVARTGLLEREIEEAAAPAGLIVLRGAPPWLVDRGFMDQAASRIVDTLREFHKANPLAPGMAKEDLRARVLPGAPPVLLDTLLAGIKNVVAEEERIRLSSHQVALEGEEAAALEKIEAAFAGAGLAVPALGEVLARSGVEPGKSRSLLQILLKSRKLTKIGDDLVFHYTALATLRSVMAGHKGQRFSVADFKEWTGISRKYAIPLLEFLDRERVTRREGDSRVVL